MKDKIKDLRQDSKEMETKGYTEQAKSRFNDPIAKTTPWTPMIVDHKAEHTGFIKIRMGIFRVVRRYGRKFPSLRRSVCFLNGITWLAIILIYFNL